jgi:hypothetical protein
MITFDDMIEERKKHEEEEKEFQRELNRLRMEDLRKNGIEPTFDEDGNSIIPPKKETWDHPNTMENSTATILWIVVMLVGSIFKGNWVIWIIATVVWAKFITRHNK